MKKARIEINRVKILKGRERWRIYFIIVLTDPSKSEQQLVFVQPPDNPILTTNRQDNNIIFNYGNEGEEGKILFIHDIPKSKTLSLSIYVMHSREKTRNLSELAEIMAESTGAKLVKQVAKLAGVSSPVAVVAGTVISLLPRLLSKIKDKQLGCIIADESFDNVLSGSRIITRNRLSGFIEMEYNWVLM